MAPPRQWNSREGESGSDPTERLLENGNAHTCLHETVRGEGRERTVPAQVGTKQYAGRMRGRLVEHWV
ncbi:MAG: hypothetical protein WBM00_05070 [Solirubrobacterales bacterium]